MHFLRNVLAQIPKGNAEMVLAAIRTIFAQPDAAHVHEQFSTIAVMFGRSLPKVEAMLHEAHDEWAVSDRRYLSESSMAMLERPPLEEEGVSAQLPPA